MAASSMRALSLANHLDVEHGVLRQQLGEYRSPRARLQLTLLVQLPVRTDYQLCPLLRRELGPRVSHRLRNMRPVNEGLKLVLRDRDGRAVGLVDEELVGFVVGVDTKVAARSAHPCDPGDNGLAHSS